MVGVEDGNLVIRSVFRRGHGALPYLPWAIYFVLNKNDFHLIVLVCVDRCNADISAVCQICGLKVVSCVGDKYRS